MLMLAVLEYGIEDEEMAELTKATCYLPDKEKPRRTAHLSEPDVERLINPQEYSCQTTQSSHLQTNYTKHTT